MPARQLQLFEPARPFLAHIGPEFFSAAPKAPGVYVITGDEERVLYIGQSRNLKARLGSYKNARRDATHRKTLRLAHAARSITYEICECAEAAILREKKLIALHKPRFNRAGVMPRAPRHVSLASDGSKLELILSETPGAGTTCASFATGGRRIFAALCRSLWNLAFSFPAFETFPAGLLTPAPPPTVRIPVSQTDIDLHHLAKAFLEKSSRVLIDAITTAAERHAHSISPCHAALCLEDIDILDNP
jgi:predicted GIY-YIG superfamily endonuclease